MKRMVGYLRTEENGKLGGVLNASGSLYEDGKEVEVSEDENGSHFGFWDTKKNRFIWVHAEKESMIDLTPEIQKKIGVCGEVVKVSVRLLDA